MSWRKSCTVDPVRLRELNMVRQGDLDDLL